MTIYNLLTMIGGLALFLFGMEQLGIGLKKISGGKMEQFLERCTSSPLKAVLLGTGVTAVIQSSSATTVMVVGFVNSGVMKLTQAVGIIMGVNIGTTATSWILSLTGISGDNLFINLLKPSSFSPILAMIGVLIIMVSKSEKAHDIGYILMGFAILMFGMDMMSSAVLPLADMLGFTNFMLKFSNPLLGVLIGAILTAIIQSSSASIGILQALCNTGAVSYSAAIPIIMGQNIGTCITAILASINGNRNAKRVALIHLSFNMIGTIIYMSVIYLINGIIGLSFWNEVATPAGIAILHSSFNISATLVLLPFRSQLIRLSQLILPMNEATNIYS